MVVPAKLANGIWGEPVVESGLTGGLGFGEVNWLHYRQLAQAQLRKAEGEQRADCRLEAVQQFGLHVR